MLLGTLPNGEDVATEIGDCLAILAGQTREAMFAVIDAKLELSGEPVAAATVDPANVRESAAGLALISFEGLGKDGEKIHPLIEDALRNKVTLIVYQNAEKAGSFGEKHVLTTEDGALQRFALLGTEEGDAVLKEFSRKAAARRMRRGLADDDEEEDDM